jgi:hypothetical protein
MALQPLTLIYGVGFLLVGVAGFIPGLLAPVPPGSPPLAVPQGHGMLFGILPVNVLHNLVHLVFGIWGVAAQRTALASRGYLRTVGIAYLALALLGAIPATSTLFGLAPIWGGDIWLHVILALPALYVGFFVPARPRVAA